MPEALIRVRNKWTGHIEVDLTVKQTKTNLGPIWYGQPTAKSWPQEKAASTGEPASKAGGKWVPRSDPSMKWQPKASSAGEPASSDVVAQPTTEIAKSDPYQVAKADSAGNLCHQQQLQKEGQHLPQLHGGLHQLKLIHPNNSAHQFQKIQARVQIVRTTNYKTIAFCPMCNVAVRPSSEEMVRRLKTLATLIEPTQQLHFVPNIVRGNKSTHLEEHSKGRERAPKYRKRARKHKCDGVG